MGSERIQAESESSRSDAAERPAARSMPGGRAGELLRLQTTVGNRAVGRRVARSRRALLQRDTVTGASRTVAAPPPSRVPIGPPQAPAAQPSQDDDNAVHPAVDVAADAHSVTVTAVLRNFNLPQSSDGAVVDILHEPGVSLQVTPGDAPTPVVQAAIAALNVHLRNHGRELIELSASPQGSVDGTGRWSAGAQAQAEIHVTAAFSFTVSSSVAATPHSPDVDPGSRRLVSGSSVDLNWSPLSVGVLFHLDAPSQRYQRDRGFDYAAADAEGRYINWVIGQLTASDFGDLERYELVRPLLEAMRAAQGEEAQLTLHMGAMQPAEVPSGLRGGLERAAQVIAASDPQFSGLRRVRVSMLNLGPQANGPEQVFRWTLLDVSRQDVTPAPASSSASPPPLQTWGAPAPATH